MTEQDYQPYRSALLTRIELSELNKIVPMRALLAIAWLWVLVASAWLAAMLIDRWWVTVAAAVFVGNRYYSLFIIGHDGLHRRLHPKIQINDFINDMFILGPIGAITRINRLNHMNHHSSLATEADPDGYKYSSRISYSPIMYFISFTGLPFVLQAVRNVFLGTPKPKAEPRINERYRFRDIAILVFWQLFLAAALTFMFGWWGYFLMWWLPVYAFTYAADIARVFCEHSVADNGPVRLASRLVTYQSNQLELAIFAPMNMNHHVAHHLWPSIPFYNLPKATELLYSRTRSLPDNVLKPQMRASYVSYLRNYYSSIKRHAGQLL
jgi:fatty acid desaturase